MRKELTISFDSWYVIDGDEHLKFGSFSDALEILGARGNKIKPNKQLILMSSKEYNTWHSRRLHRPEANV